MAQYQCALRKSYQKQLFRNIYKLFPYVLYNIKYLLVIISYSGGYPLLLIVTYSMSSANYGLVLSDRPFPNLLFYQILLFCLHFRKYVNDLVIHPQKSTFAKFTSDFSCNFTNFWLEDWEASTKKTKSSIYIKLWHFHCLSHSLFYLPLQLNKSRFQKIDPYKLNLVPRGTRLIDINYLKLRNILLHI